MTSSTQRGFSLLAMLTWAVVIAFGALLTMKLWPVVTEYMTTKSAVQRLEATLPANTTESAIRHAFDQQKAVEYQIATVSGKDLIIDRPDGGSFKLGFAYDKEVGLFGPVYLLLKYRYGPQ